MADTYSKKLEADTGTVGVDTQIIDNQQEIYITVQGGEGNSKGYAWLSPAQARKLAAMLTEAAAIAEGKPARPDKITDIPLHYLHRADASDYEHLSNRPDMRKQDRAKYDESTEDDGA